MWRNWKSKKMKNLLNSKGWLTKAVKQSKAKVKKNSKKKSNFIDKKFPTKLSKEKLSTWFIWNKIIAAYIQQDRLRNLKEKLKSSWRAAVIQ